VTVSVRITYCAECGCDAQALELAGSLMRAFGNDLARVEIIPWLDGTFDVAVDGEPVHSMRREGGFPEAETILGAVRARLAAGRAS